ncbi:MAG TPA: nuclear transport factor 2 family protein [Thermoanaerobaculia bacterium]|nr:nuclear transport factor 2 family protein [Thermoanaerobaculia bacterium]
MTPFRLFPGVLGAFLAIAVLPGQSCGAPKSRREDPCGPRPVTEDLRKELLGARDAAWRAFFQTDPAVIEKAIGPELIAIQESDEKWESRASVTALSRFLNQKGVRLLRLEFPRTEIQVFGNVAILYYTYVFETGIGDKSTGVDSGRGTEIFVHRDGRWVDVGWHLDNGPFYRKEGVWMRAAGDPQPRPGASARAGE